MLLCSLPLALCAAAEAPYYTPFQAVVSAAKGAKLYEIIDDEIPVPDVVPNGRTLPKRTIVTVTDEQSVSDTVYYYVQQGNDGLGYLRGGDVTLQLEPVAPNEEYRFDPLQHFVVMRSGGLDLHEAPNEASPSVGKAPKGAVVAATHADMLDTDLTDMDMPFSVWSYVTYNGKSGWMSTNEYTGDCARSVKYRDTSRSQLGKCKTTVPMQLYDRVDGRYDTDAQIVATVPADTELTYDIYNGVTNEALITYQGKQGWADPLNADAVVSVDGACMLVTELPIYRSPDSGEKNQTGQTAPVFALLPYDLYYIRTVGEAEYASTSEYWYHIRTDDTEGWILLPSGSFPGEDLIDFGQAQCFRLPEQNRIPVYAQPFGGERLMTLDGGAIFCRLFHYKDWDYVKIADDEYGWTQFDESEGYLPGKTLYSLTPAQPGEPEETTPAEPTEPNDPAEPSTGEAAFTGLIDWPPTEKPVVFTPTNIGIIIGAAAIILLAVIGVLRARKKKRN